jgi:hypothetical protein
LSAQTLTELGVENIRFTPPLTHSPARPTAFGRQFFPLFLGSFLFLGLLSPCFADMQPGVGNPKHKQVLELWKKNKPLTPTRVRKMLGKPSRVGRQILYRQVREQWIYEAPQSLLVVELVIAYGGAARVQSVHLLRPRKP